MLKYINYNFKYSYIIINTIGEVHSEGGGMLRPHNWLETTVQISSPNASYLGLVYVKVRPSYNTSEYKLKTDRTSSTSYNTYIT